MIPVSSRPAARVILNHCTPSVPLKPILDEIVSKLGPGGIRRVYEECASAQGMPKFWESGVKDNGWNACHAIGRVDTRPSAAVHLSAGLYKDSGEDRTIDIFTAAQRWHVEGGGRFYGVVKFLADRAGVDVSGVPSGERRYTIREHIYLDYNDEPHTRVTRYQLDSKADGGEGRDWATAGWTGSGWATQKGSTKVENRPPYRFAEIREAAAEGNEFYIVEGEHAADLTSTLFGMPTTTSGSSSTWKNFARFISSPHYSAPFIGARVAIFADNDERGRAYARKVATILRPVVASVKVVHIPDLPPRCDVGDWILLNGVSFASYDKLMKIVADTPEFVVDESDSETEIDQPLPERSSAPRIVSTVYTEVEEKPLSWLIDGYVVEDGIALVGGKGAAGKTTVISAIIDAVTRGAAFGRSSKPVDRGAVIYASHENRPGRMRGLLRVAGADLSLVHTLEGVLSPDGRRQRWTLAGLDSLAALVKELEAVGPKVRLMVFDPVTSYLPPKFDDSNASELRDLLDPMADFCEEYKVACLLVTHVRKSTGGTQTADESFMGSGAYVHCSRVAWICCANPDRPNEPRQFGVPGSGFTRGLMIPVKVNDDAPADAHAYEISEDWPANPGIRRLTWDDAPGYRDPDEVIKQLAANKKNGPAAAGGSGPDSDAVRCTVWLARRLINGPVAKKSIQREAGEYGWKIKTLASAMTALGIDPTSDPVPSI